MPSQSMARRDAERQRRRRRRWGSKVAPVVEGEMSRVWPNSAGMSGRQHHRSRIPLRAATAASESPADQTGNQLEPQAIAKEPWSSLAARRTAATSPSP